MSDNLYHNLHTLIKKGEIKTVKDTSGILYGLLKSKQGIFKAYPLYANEFKVAFKKVYLRHFDELLSTQAVMYICEMLEVLAMDNAETVETCKRIYNNGEQYAYELNAEDGTVIWIEDGEISIEQVEGILFKHSANYANQVLPDFSVEHTKLLSYIEKHFHLKSDKEIKLLALFLVTSLWGLEINHPMLVLTGEKGSSKSTTLRKIEKLIDPKSSDLGGISKGTDGLELKLTNSYFVSLDNLSYLNRRISDTLAVAITGGSVSKRALYKNTDEIVFDIKAVVAINGVSLVARESDLLDRSLIITLKRLSSKEIITEEELWQEFEKDRPAILGCCFQILAIALNDSEPIETDEKIRMADFHVACIKVGRALGIPEDEVTDILWTNQKSINKHTLDEDPVALCVMELMSKRSLYTKSMSDLLCELQYIAIQNGMPVRILPKTPNHLRMRLDKVQSNLKSECGITYTVKNVGAFKQIRIQKK